MGITYAQAGVDQAGKDRAIDRILAMARRTHGRSVVDVPWGFAGFYRLTDVCRGMKDPLLVSCTDGVGTKLMLARRLGRHDSIGIDLVAMSVNDMVVTGARPLFFLDYVACGKVDRPILLDVLKGIVDGCRQAECALLGGETAEMPGAYPEGEYDVAGFAVGVVDRPKLLEGRDVRAGDEVIGLASSGVHSNGYSLVRRILETARINLEGRVASLGRSAGEALLAPTRIYVRSLLEVFRRHAPRRAVRAAANITGGGMIENIPRVLPKGLGVEVREGTWEMPAVFPWLQRLGAVDRDEMYRVFNMGVGLVLVTRPADTAGVLRTLEKCGETASVIGRVVKGRTGVAVRHA